MENFVHFIEKFDSFFKLLLALLVLLTVWFYFYKKSGSLYNITDKLWSIFVGQKEFYNNGLNTFHQNQHDVAKFNSIYNLNAINIKELESFTAWVKANNYDIRKISGIKGWFNISTLKVSKPRRLTTCLMVLGFIVLLLSGLFISLCGMTPNAIVKLNKHDSWFILNHERAKPLFNRIAINKDNCKDTGYDRRDYSQKSGITPASVNGICQAFTDKKEAAAIDRIIKSQQILLYMGIYIIFWGCYIIKYTYLRLNALDFIAVSLKRGCDPT